MHAYTISLISPLLTPSDPKNFLLVAAERSVRTIALDSVIGSYLDVPLYSIENEWMVNAVDYLLTGVGEGRVYWAEFCGTGMKTR